MYDEAALAARRREMVHYQIRRRGIRDPRVLDALEEVPRHLFIPPGLIDRAYDDGPLPIGDGQTISQPFIVALMTEALELSGIEKVLEVGTGSGYQAAILSRLCAEVVTIERIAVLSDAARRRVETLGCLNVRFVVGDGSGGVPSEAPFDRILVTAAAPALPEPLFAQLAEGGLLVAPFGGYTEQELTAVRKVKGVPRYASLGGCRFVPLIGTHGFLP